MFFFFYYLKVNCQIVVYLFGVFKIYGFLYVYFVLGFGYVCVMLFCLYSVFFIRRRGVVDLEFGVIYIGNSVVVQVYFLWSVLFYSMDWGGE